MNEEEIRNLDPRAKWEKLQKFDPCHRPRLIHIPDEDLKTLCLQECSVLVSKFNVLSRISDAYDKDCLDLNVEPNEETRQQLFREKGMKVYKKFYEPRLEWFERQREYLQYLRQQEFFYKSVIANTRKVQNVKLEGVDRNVRLPSLDMFDVSAQEFMKEAVTLPEIVHYSGSLERIGKEVEIFSEFCRDL